MHESEMKKAAFSALKDAMNHVLLLNEKDKRYPAGYELFLIAVYGQEEFDKVPEKMRPFLYALTEAQQEGMEKGYISAGEMLCCLDCLVLLCQKAGEVFAEDPFKGMTIPDGV